MFVAGLVIVWRTQTLLRMLAVLVFFAPAMIRAIVDFADELSNEGGSFADTINGYSQDLIGEDVIDQETDAEAGQAAGDGTSGFADNIAGVVTSSPGDAEQAQPATSWLTGNHPAASEAQASSSQIPTGSCSETTTPPRISSLMASPASCPSTRKAVVSGRLPMMPTEITRSPTIAQS